MKGVKLNKLYVCRINEQLVFKVDNFSNFPSRWHGKIIELYAWKVRNVPNWLILAKLGNYFNDLNFMNETYFQHILIVDDEIFFVGSNQTSPDMS